MYRSSTTGAPTAEFDRLGGYAAVKAAAEAAGYSATPEFIQSYEVANNLTNSAAAQDQGQQAPTQEDLTQMMRDSNNQRLNETPPNPDNYLAQERLAREMESIERQREAERAYYAANAASRAAGEQQVAAQQAAAQQATAAQAQQQIAAQYASAQQIAAAQAAQQAAMQAVQSAAQARSTGLLDVAPRAAATAGPAINRPTAMMQPSYAQVAPAQITNRAITGTPYSSIYSPATMRQNAPTLASVQAAARSSNPYAALMALSQQQSMPGSYAGPAGATAANPYLGGYNPSIYNPATTGPLTTPSAGIYSSGAGVGPGGAEGGIKGGGQTGYGSLANLAGEAQRAGFTTIGNFLGGLVPVGAEYNRVDLDTGKTVKGATTQADIDALSGKNDPGSSVALSGSRQDFRAQELAAQNLAERNAFTTSMVNGLLGQSNMYAQQADALPGTTTNAQPQGYDTAGSRAEAAALANAAANLAAAESTQFDPNSGFTSGANADGYGGGDLGAFLAKGGMVNMKPQMRNPPGPDDGYAALQNGEYVIRKSAVKKYGSNIFEQINAGRIPAQRLKSLLE
jgi:hypothetical protein